MRKVEYVNPFRCRMWALHDRLDGTISEENCRDEIESFERNGQIVPVLGRPLRDDTEYDVELIFGARRLFVARHVRKDLLVELREVTDREAIVAMDVENRQRKDISPYERGMSYARWLRTGYFESQDDIARSLRVSNSQVSRLLKIARLPAVVVAAFQTPLDIHERWGIALSAVLEDPNRRETTIDRARRLSKLCKKMSPEDVYRQLLGVSGERRARGVKIHDEVVKDDEGKPIFRIRRLRKSVALLLPSERISVNELAALRQAVLQTLSCANAQAVDSEVELSHPRGNESVTKQNGTEGLLPLEVPRMC